MNRLLLLFYLLMLTPIVTQSQNCIVDANGAIAYNTIDFYQKSLLKTSKDYTIELHEEKISNNTYNFNIAIDLKNGSYYVSPHSVIAYKGRFTIVLPENKNIAMIDNIIETPRSVEIFDDHPFVNGKINWVKMATKYNQKLRINTSKDFSINGHIQFTIEPKCTLEKIPFRIEQKSGKLKITMLDDC